MRHRQTKGPDTDRPDLNNRVTSRLYPFREVSPSSGRPAVFIHLFVRHIGARLKLSKT